MSLIPKWIKNVFMSLSGRFFRLCFPKGLNHLQRSAVLIILHREKVVKGHYTESYLVAEKTNVERDPPCEADRGE